MKQLLLISVLGLFSSSVLAKNVVCRGKKILISASETSVSYSDLQGKVIAKYEAESAETISTELDDPKEIFGFREGILVIYNRLTTDESNYAFFEIKENFSEYVSCRYL